VKHSYYFKNHSAPCCQKLWKVIDATWS